ncbi:MAG TPA: helix-turn-helix domain-containing protein [Candidatus Dormibacteraeota bacterium]|nr:helix-turn-helix domain-containing protein [Candidatus Dormibacteraeota bacterium]
MPAALADLLRHLAPQVLRVVAAPREADVVVGEVVLYDPDEASRIPARSLVLVPGLASMAAPRELVEALARAGVAAVAAKGCERLCHEPLPETRRTGMALLSIPNGAAWGQVLALLQSTIGASEDPDAISGIEAGDLFAVANVVAATVDSPVTIEDPNLRVLAYSGRQEEADEARWQTILGRRDPDVWLREMRRQGLLRRLHRERGTLYIDTLPGVMPRLVVAVRAGDEVLGSVWAAVRRRPPPEVEAAFAESASFVAVHLLRHRLTLDVHRHLRGDLVSALLSGTGLAAEAARRLRLDGSVYRVVGVALSCGDPAAGDAALLHCWDLLSLHLSAVDRTAATALLDGVLYGIVPSPPGRPGEARLRQALAGFVERCPQPTARQLLVAIGGAAEDIGALPRSRQEADHVLRVLRRRGGRQLAEIEEVRMSALLLHLADLARERPFPPSKQLLAQVEEDRRLGTEFTATLRAYLEEFGDVNRAAARLGVHTNTVRNRMRRVVQLWPIDLDDPEERLGLLLELKLLLEEA